MARSIFRRNRPTPPCAKCAEPAPHKEHGEVLCFSCASVAAGMSPKEFRDWFLHSPESGTSIALKRLDRELRRFQSTMGKQEVAR